MRGAPPKFEAVWAGLNAAVLIGPRNSYFWAMTCRGTYSIGAEPGGCDGARIKTALWDETKESRLIWARKLPEAVGCPHTSVSRCHDRRVTLCD